MGTACTFRKRGPVLGTSKEDGPSVLGKGLHHKRVPMARCRECGPRESQRPLLGGERAVGVRQGLQRDGAGPIRPNTSIFLSCQGQPDGLPFCNVRGCLWAPSSTLWPGAAPGWAAGRWAGRSSLQQQTFEHTDVFRRLMGWDGEQCAGRVEGCWSQGPILPLGLPHQEAGASLGCTGSREEKGSAETVVSSTG